MTIGIILLVFNYKHMKKILTNNTNTVVPLYSHPLYKHTYKKPLYKHTMLRTNYVGVLKSFVAGVIFQRSAD